MELDPPGDLSPRHRHRGCQGGRFSRVLPVVLAIPQRHRMPPEGSKRIYKTWESHW